MKKTIFLLAVISSLITLNAQRVALHSSLGVQYFWGTTGLSSAYNAANAGDTIYLPGGTFTTPISFGKSLFIFGAGHYVDSSLVTGKTFINGNVVLKEDADGFYMEGLEVTGKISFANNESVNNVVIKRCKINAEVEILGDLSNPSQNIAFIGNVLVGGVNLNNAQVVLVSNNIIQTGLEGTNGNIINNNVFLNRFGNGYYENFRGNNNKLSNNIIVLCGSYGITTNVHFGNDYRNNLITCATPGYGASPTLISNYTNVDQASIFVDQSGHSFDYAHSYHLQNPETYLGTDGTEIGIYGGNFPYKEGAVPSNPHFQLNNIAPTTDGNGDLNIQIQVEAQED
ncbi:MAG: hypothetical protein RBS19_01665 [Bacteroidales bacterium]|nr:hypothetical protein [Bacteroidales bacterium]MDY0215638.1 hypothetical protein [Bacteroidales bacterium]